MTILRPQTMVILFFGGIFLALPMYSSAQSMTEEQGDAILKELKEIRVLLKDFLTQGKVDLKRSHDPAPIPVDAMVSIDKEPTKGDPTAKVTLVEFSDYQCPFCARHALQTMPKLEEEYIKTGKVKYVFKDFPLEQIHHEAIQAAAAANCSGMQGKYWEMHNLLFMNQQAVSSADIENYAKELDLNLETFQGCLQNGAQQKEIREDMTEGGLLTVRGTPTFFIGITDPKSSTVKVVQIFRGAQPYARYKALIDSFWEK